MKRQMYKIYIKDCLIILTSKGDKDYYVKKFKPKLVAKYTGGKKSLLNYIDLLEKSKKAKSVIIYAKDYKGLKKDYKSLYNIVPAAGGIVVNDKKEILFIYRRKHWDLPKGKMEGKESKREAAIREVEEETGIKNIKLLKKVGVTNHTFRIGSKKRSIKKSHWYLMRTKKQKLTPQKEEDIEKAIWLKLDSFLKNKKPVYISIIDILDKLQNKLNKKSWKGILDE